MKVGVIELSCKNHSVMIYNWVRICNVNEWKCIIYTTEEIYKEVECDLIGFDYETCLIENISTLGMLKIRRSIVSNNYVVITSLQNYFIHYILLYVKRVRFILTIHNLNIWFLPGRRENLKSRLKGIIRSIWLNIAEAVILNSNNMLTYYERNDLSKKSCLVVPFSMRQMDVSDLTVKGIEEPLTVVYPGMVSKVRKDYSLFFHLATNNPNVRFILLGKIVKNEGGEELLNEIKSKSIKNIIYYEDYVDQFEFSRVMCSSDIIYSDINIKSINQGTEERYGVTKDSGVSYLMLEYCLPLLVNDEFNNFAYLDEVTYKYSTLLEADNLIKKFENDRECIIQLKKRVISLREHNSVDRVAANVSTFLGKL